MWTKFGYSDILRNRFTIGECRHVIGFHEELDSTVSKFTRGDGAPLRDSGIFWLYRNDKTEWAFDRLGQALEEYNANYNYDIHPRINSAQLTRYEIGQQYGWHIDIGQGDMSLRKVSMVLELSAPSDHVGGGLEIFNDFEVNNKLHLNQGDVACFNAFTPHRATPVTAGVRWSLVVWVLGDRPFQ